MPQLLRGIVIDQATANFSCTKEEHRVAIEKFCLQHQLTSFSQPGQFWPPTRLAEWSMIIRLEKFFPAQLDEQMRRRLIDELFDNWLKEQIKQLGPLRFLGSSSSPPG